MDDAEVKPSEEVELIAISSGSVSCADLKSAFEERIDRVRNYSYRRGLTKIHFQRVLSGSSIENDRETEMTRLPPIILTIRAQLLKLVRQLELAGPQMLRESPPVK